jgi:hypothetical protein
MDVLDAQVCNLFKLPIKERNQVIDAAFYDFGVLTPDERAKLSPLVDLKGTIIVVSPRAAGRSIRHYTNALRFMLKEGDDIGGIAIAGVGSSVLGTAALARSVADAYGIEVAGIVTGYGVADVVTEALGGWFFYGQIDRFRYAAEQALGSLFTLLPEAPPARAGTQGAESFNPPVDSRFLFPGNNSDVGNLLDILIARPRNLRVLVGHSKGNLLISFVLHHMVDELGDERHPLYDELRLVTLGAVVNLPRQFAHRRQFLGQLDWFGGINSELDVPHETVPGAWHHLNPCIPFAMPVADVLRSVPLPAGPTGGGESASSLMKRWRGWSRGARGQFAPAGAEG